MPRGLQQQKICDGSSQGWQSLATAEIEAANRIRKTKRITINIALPGLLAFQVTKGPVSRGTKACDRAMAYG